MDNIQIDLNMFMVFFTIIQVLMVIGFIGGIIYLNMKLNKLLKEKQAKDNSSNKLQ